MPKKINFKWGFIVSGELCVCLAILFWAQNQVLAAEPISVFGKNGTSLIDERGHAFHPEFEDNGDYGETWFFMIQTEAEDYLLAVLAITNLGLRTFDGIIDLDFYPHDGPPIRLHREHKFKDISAASDHLDIRIGKSRVWRDAQTIRMQIDDEELALDLTFKKGLPAYQFGNGRIKLYADQSAEWAIGFNAPRSLVIGQLNLPQKSYALSGFGYHDHAYATIKVPSFVRSWLTLRILKGPYALIIHQLQIADKFGGGTVQMGLLGKDKELLGTSRDFTYTPLAFRTDPLSGYQIPTRLKVEINTGSYQIVGVIKEARFLGSVDVLAQVSWPVQFVIKAFYSRPFLIRFVGEYDFKITDPQGRTEAINGTALLESNYY